MLGPRPPNRSSSASSSSATASLFVPIKILHPLWMIAFLVLTATTFSLFGFIIGIWAKGFEQLQFIPMLVITAADLSGRRFLFHRYVAAGLADGHPVQSRGLSDQRFSLELLRDLGRERGVSLAMTLGFFVICLVVVGWIFGRGIG